MATAACDAMGAAGRWNDARNPFLILTRPGRMRHRNRPLASRRCDVLSAKKLELPSIALDAWFTHLYAPRIRQASAGSAR